MSPEDITLRTVVAAFVAGDVYSNLSDTIGTMETAERTAEIAVAIADAIIARTGK